MAAQWLLHSARHGHRVVEGARASGGVLHENTIAVDFTRDFDAAAWCPRLRGVDAVVNTVGILRERGNANIRCVCTFEHRALYLQHVLKLAIARVIQISALGADEMRAVLIT